MSSNEREENGNLLKLVDEYIGARIRIRRNLLGMSQDQLAQMLGISFQQLQKYEKGNNRIAASRIWQLSKALNVSVSYFFEGIERNLSYKGITFESGTGSYLCDSYEEEEMPDMPSEMELSVKELVEAFISIKDPAVAKHILGLVKTLASQNQAPIDTITESRE